MGRTFNISSTKFYINCVFNYILQVVDIAALIGHKHCWLVLECYRGWSLLCSPHNASWQLLKCLKVDGSSTQSMYLMDPYNIMEICLGRLTLIHTAVSSGAGGWDAVITRIQMESQAEVHLLRNKSTYKCFELTARLKIYRCI